MEFLGKNNSWIDYVLVLVIYGCLFVVIRQSSSVIELNFRRRFWFLYFGWAVSVFIANYLLYLGGFMSFLPWLNNAFHTFIWIGFCLGFVYAGSHSKPFWEQFILFAFFSFIVKWTEREILGTWEHDHFFFIDGNMAYIVGWSLLDGLYPVISKTGITIASRFMPGLKIG
ncbi:hypothetical protein K1X84_09365 [bacterium]|nr:hypothetical protein [bacterium]